MTVKSWFHNEVNARAIAAAVWTILLQSPLVLVLKFLFSGYQGLWNSLSLLLHFGSLFNFLLIPVCICGLTFAYLKFYKVEPVVYITRWILLKQVISPAFVLLMLIYAIIGGILMNSYFSTSVPFLGALSTRCSQKDAWCLNEMHLFGVLFGGLLGLVESWDYFFTERRMVKIPHIQQHVKVAVWSHILPLIKSALMASAKKYFVYLFIYLVFGGSVRSYVLSATRLSLDEPLDSIVGLMNVSLALRCILIGSACIFTIRLSNLLFQLFEIKPITFSIVRFNDDSTPLLQEAMTSDSPLLRLWACRDWNTLTEQSIERRSIIFSVSQPGNHPHNWNSVISTILPQCLHFVSLLKGEGNVVPKYDNPETAPPPQSPPFDTYTSPIRMRSLALKSPTKITQAPEQPKTSLQDRLQAKVHEVLDNLKKKPIIHFLWGELPDAKRRQTFAKAESILLLIDGLSHFVAASFSEDKFGVVQKDLPDILSMLLDLQAAVEVRGASSGVLPKRTETLANPPSDVQLKYKLKWAVKSSIYRLVVRFQRHIMNVPLPSSQKQMLEQYLEFRVG